MREGGASTAPFDSLNLGLHVGDDLEAVIENRRRLARLGGLPHLPHWPHQVHGNNVVSAARLNSVASIEADAVFSNNPREVCAVLTADCLPIVLGAGDGDEVATVHAGWKGLYSNILAHSVMRFSCPAAQIFAWIGPGISAQAYEVDEKFKKRFIAQNAAFSSAFAVRNDKNYADLYAIADICLRAAGVEQITRYPGCTYTEPARFYSYRRESATGRMATLAWIDA